MTMTMNPDASATITPRDIHFDVNVDRMADWAGGDVVRTTYFNALSMMFPIGERFFISSVAAFKDAVTDPQLQRDVKAFVTQEALHTREHLDYNESMRPIVDLDVVDERQAAKIAHTKENAPPIAHLAITCALEHFTAIMAHELLKNPAYLKDADPSYARLWTWHAIEECEHKSVAFDVLKAATKGNDYKVRLLTMLSVSVNFTFDTIWNSNQIFKKAGTNKSPITWAKFAWFLLGKPGFLRNLLPAYIQYYRKDFHPSQIDDSRERVRGLSRIAYGSPPNSATR